MRKDTKMKIVATKIPAVPYTDCFELEIIFMHGDADRYSTNSFRTFHSHKLVPAIEFFRLCVQKFPYGKGGNDGFWDVDGYSDYGDEIIPMDNPYCDGHASIEEINVYYYNSVGLKLKAEIIE